MFLCNYDGLVSLVLSTVDNLRRLQQSYEYRLLRRNIVLWGTYLSINGRPEGRITKGGHVPPSEYRVIVENNIVRCTHMQL